MSDVTLAMAEEDPERYQILKNGSIYDHSIKKIVKAPTVPNFTDHKQAQAAALSRHQAAQEAAITGLSRVSTSKSALDAWANIVESQAKLAMDTDKGRSSTEAARFTGQTTGFLPDRRTNQDENTGQTTLSLSIPTDSLLLLVDRLRQTSTNSGEDGVIDG